MVLLRHSLQDDPHKASSIRSVAVLNVPPANNEISNSSMSLTSVTNTSVTNSTRPPAPTAPTLLSTKHSNLTGLIAGTGGSTSLKQATGNVHAGIDSCGSCQIFAPEVQLYIWSLTSSADCSSFYAGDNLNLETSTLSISSSSQTLTIPSISDATTAVVAGSTLTFPSYYLAVHGDVSVRDSCGVIGKTYHDPTIAIAPGDLSTLSYPTNAVQSNESPPLTSPYDPAACHTYGLDRGSLKHVTKTAKNGSLAFTSRLVYSMGPPFNPILLPPQDLSNLDPDWQACTTWGNHGEVKFRLFFESIAGPRVLQTATALVDPKSTALAQNQPSLTAIAPSPAAKPSVPAAEMTAKPIVSDNTDSSSQPADSSFHGDLPALILRPFRKDSSPDFSGFESPNPQLSSNAESPGSRNMIFAGSTFLADQAGKFEVDGKTMSAGAEMTIRGTPVSLAPNGNVVVLDGNTRVPHNENNPSLTIDNPRSSLSPFTFDSLGFTPGAASNFLVEGQTLSPGSQIKVQGTPVSLAVDGRFAIVAGSFHSLPLATARISTADNPSALPLGAIKSLAFGNQRYAADADSAFIIASESLSAGTQLIFSSNITLSLSPIGATAVAIADGSSQMLTREIPTSITAANSKVFASAPDSMMVFDGNRYTAKDIFAFTVVNEAPAPGAQIVLPLQATLSLSPNGATAFAIADGTTQTLLVATRVPSGPAITAPFGSMITTLSGSETLIVDGQTLTHGGKLTVNGEIISWGQMQGANSADVGDIVILESGMLTTRTGIDGGIEVIGTGTGIRLDGAASTAAVVFEGKAGRLFDKAVEARRGMWMVVAMVVLVMTWW